MTQRVQVPNGKGTVLIQDFCVYEPIWNPRVPLSLALRPLGESCLTPVDSYHAPALGYPILGLGSYNPTLLGTPKNGYEPVCYKPTTTGILVSLGHPEI